MTTQPNSSSNITKESNDQATSDKALQNNKSQNLKGNLTAKKKKPTLKAVSNKTKQNAGSKQASNSHKVKHAEVTSKIKKSIQKIVKPDPKAVQNSKKTNEPSNRNNTDSINPFLNKLKKDFTNQAQSQIDNIRKLSQDSKMSMAPNQFWHYGTTMMRVTEEINNQIASYSNELFINNMNAAKEFLKCTTVNDLLSLQESLIQQNLKFSIDNYNEMVGNVLKYCKA